MMDQQRAFSEWTTDELLALMQKEIAEVWRSAVWNVPAIQEELQRRQLAAAGYDPPGGKKAQYIQK